MEARYRTLVEGIPAVTFMAALDEGRNELYVSPQIEALLGFSQQEWLDNPVLWYTQLHPEDRERWHDRVRPHLLQRRAVPLGVPLPRRDGRVVWVHGEAKLVREEGRPLFLQGVAFDITGIKQAEEELKALNQTLEERVAERTAVAEQRAQELARSNASAGAVRLRGRPRPAPAIAHHEELHPEAGRAPTRGGSTSRPATTSPAASTPPTACASSSTTCWRSPGCGARARNRRRRGRAGALAGACGNLQAAIEESGGEVTADGLPIVLADATQLAQLFQNLVNNALKFRSDRPPRVHVSARPEGDYWLFAVADNGIGIEPQYLGADLRAGRAPA